MILCAAVKFYIEATKKEVVVACRRHCDAYAMLRDMGYEPKKGYKKIDEGFISTNGMFLNRRQAYEHAVLCGQLSDTVMRNINNGMLFSEDLY